MQPASNHKYTPDFPVTPGLVLESKGRFLSEDRAKHLLLKQQHPDIEVRFIFTRSAAPIYKGSKTTYADWCRKHGFRFCDKRIPQEWLDEIREALPG